MLDEQVHILINQGGFPEFTVRRDLVETHISWVIICDAFVYKIKKPVRFPFLDFSTLQNRRYYCEREVALNSRFSDGIYLGVVAVKEDHGHWSIGSQKGVTVDFAVRMRKMDPQKQMDFLVSTGLISTREVEDLAKKIADFHRLAQVVPSDSFQELPAQFRELEQEMGYLSEATHSDCALPIRDAIEFSDRFIHERFHLLKLRMEQGFFRDCHGDLHTKNIFLLPSPQPFDCIEFNDGLRQIDVANDIAFLCMDLEVMGRKDLSEVFLSAYNSRFPVLNGFEDQLLFIYYKAYRANIRAKVNSIKSRNTSRPPDKNRALQDTARYIRLMSSYIAQMRQYSK